MVLIELLSLAKENITFPEVCGFCQLTYEEWCKFAGFWAQIVSGTHLWFQEVVNNELEDFWFAICVILLKGKTSQAPCEFPGLPYTAQVVEGDRWVWVKF